MQQIKIEHIDAKTLEAALARFRQLRARGVVRIHFRDDENAIPLTVDRVGHNFFRFAVAVHFRGIDQRHAEIDTQTQSRDLICVCVFVFTHAPGALTQRRNTLAIWQCDSLHLQSRLRDFIRRQTVKRAFCTYTSV